MFMYYVGKQPMRQIVSDHCPQKKLHSYFTFELLTNARIEEVNHVDF